MKSNFIFLFIFLLMGCQVHDEKSPYEKNPEGLLGKWQIVERTFSIGGPPQTEEVENGAIFNFKAESTFTTSGFDQCYEGTFSVDGDELTLTSLCQVEEAENSIVYQMSFQEDFMELFPIDPICIEGCSKKLKKLIQ
ncbi:lipocalin family protein [Echinicola jeungdonensis]|uniref:Lipocalin family protein n=1 Tax=Echinicola jeungdonensis TaxID=709343 RepID=A0ABV5J473_9BACT|nr:lipocalin family protein [Echinicola jeungdonensis]MDN3668144.1 lipocalin family protein [Echinicola jeungdonensis]